MIVKLSSGPKVLAFEISGVTSLVVENDQGDPLVAALELMSQDGVSHIQVTDRETPQVLQAKIAQLGLDKRDLTKIAMGK